MPSKNIVKIYLKDGIYHIYNRGVEKRDIFMNDQDYKVFLHFLKRYLLSPDHLNYYSVQSGHSNQVGPDKTDKTNKTDKIPCQVRPDRDIKIYDKIRLLCHCLMPNHYHLMIQQLTERVITDFMRRLINSYSKYFNEKYKRNGSLFQGCYKAALIKKEIHFLHLPYYIHYNPSELFNKKSNIKEEVKNYPWSSYADYLGKRNTPWLYKKGLMDQFIESEKENFAFEDSKKLLGNLTLE